MANMTFKTNLLPNSNLGYSLGSSEQKWNVYGDLKGNADTATKLSNTPNNTSTFLRGDNTWSNTLTGPLYINHTSDVSLSSNGSIVIGSTTGVNLAFDNNEIIARNNGTASTLYLNYEGGNIICGGPVQSTTFTGALNGNASTATRLAHINVGSTTSVDNTSGSFAFSGDNNYWSGCDWVGLQIGDNVDKWQVVAADNTLCFRQNDNGGTNSSWQSWVRMLTTGNYTGTLDNRYLIKTGDTMSGQLTFSTTSGIAYKGSQATYSMIRFINNTGDNYGNGIMIGGGGATLIGGGESVDQAVGQISGGSEVMYICNDGAIEFYPNLQNGWTTSYKNWIDTSGYYHAPRVYGAVWNDYAEFRKTCNAKPGQVVIEINDGKLQLCNKRCAAAAKIVTDTFGFAIGETEECKTPIAVSGRVLAYPDNSKFKIGDAVCSGKNGTISKMHWWEKILWPERIIGIVSEIPTYNIWSAGYQNGIHEIKVNGRIWIYVK